MKTLMTASGVLTAAAAFAATPIVSNVTMSQEKATRTVTITYRLAEPGVVTLDIETNTTGTASGSAYASIGGRHVQNLSGDVNKLVRTAGEHTITWHPDASWNGFKFTEPVVRPVVQFWATNNPPWYMVVDLTVKSNCTYYAAADFVPLGVSNAIYKTDKMIMRRIPAKGVRARMGTPSGEPASSYSYKYADGATITAANNEVPHFMTLTYDYYMAIYELTMMQYKRMGGNPDSSIGYGTQGWERKPFEKCNVVWFRGEQAADHYLWPKCGHEVKEGYALDRLRKFTGLVEWDLPTEAEWEFACRAGTSTGFNNGGEGDSSAAVSAVAWFSDNSGSAAHEVGLKDPNAWGLYDMHGNVGEYCLDWYSYGDAYSDGSDAVDGVGIQKAHTDSRHVKRGGHYKTGSTYLRSGFRGDFVYTGATDTEGYRLRCEAVAR